MAKRSAGKNGTAQGERKEPYKRVLTDKRRDQNRAAQKTYREKRKARLELLERIAGSAIPTDSQLANLYSNTEDQLASESSSCHNEAAPDTLRQHSPDQTDDHSSTDLPTSLDSQSSSSAEKDDLVPDFRPSDCDPLGSFYSSASGIREQRAKRKVGSYQDSSYSPFRPSTHPRWQKEGLFGGGLAAGGLMVPVEDMTLKEPGIEGPVNWPQIGLPEERIQEVQAEDIPLASCLAPSPAAVMLASLLGPEDAEKHSELLRFAATGKLDMKSIIVAGIESLKEGKPTSSTSTQEILSTSITTSSKLPDLYLNIIHPQQFTLVDICTQNALTIGLSFSELVQPHCRSPFHNPRFSFLTPSTHSQTFAPSFPLPPDLAPTPSQIAHPHHPFLDLLPLPAFRERAIALAATDPPAYDKFELKRDIFSGGLVCRRGSGQSWDRRSWEVKGWFLAKWGWLLGGDANTYKGR